MNNPARCGPQKSHPWLIEPELHGVLTVKLPIGFPPGGGLACDDFEDAKSSDFNKVQQLSTSCPYLIETECVENRAFLKMAVNCLGQVRGGAMTPPKFNDLQVSLVKARRNLGNRVYKFDYKSPIGSVHGHLRTHLI